MGYYIIHAGGLVESGNGKAPYKRRERRRRKNTKQVPTTFPRTSSLSSSSPPGATHNRLVTHLRFLACSFSPKVPSLSNDVADTEADCKNRGKYRVTIYSNTRQRHNGNVIRAYVLCCCSANRNILGWNLVAGAAPHKREPIPTSTADHSVQVPSLYVRSRNVGEGMAHAEEGQRGG